MLGCERAKSLIHPVASQTFLDAFHRSPLEAIRGQAILTSCFSTLGWEPEVTQARGRRRMRNRIGFWRDYCKARDNSYRP